jgi:AraC-like DNA-binding protein
MTVFAPSLINLWKTIESAGLDPASLFGEQDLEIKLPIDPGLRIPFEKIDRIRARVVELSGDETIGIRSAGYYHPSQLGALGYAWQASLTLRKAFQRLERFARIVNEKASVAIEDRDGCMVVSLSLDVESLCEAVRDDGALAMVTMMCRLVCGDNFRLQAVNFKHSQPADLKPYFEYFGCQLNFDREQNQLWIPLPLVDEVLAGANPELALLNDQVVTRRLALLDRNDITARVQAVLMDQLPGGNVSDESVAESLFMSARTMHRKLAEVDRNFRTLLVEMRRSLAEQYIMDNSLTLTEISLLLGFSEQSSFSRAFKNWTGQAPSEARQALT